MNTKEAFIHKIESKLEQAQITLAGFRNQAVQLTAENQSKHAKQVLDIDLKVDALKAKLKELYDANEGAWEQLIDGVEDCLDLFTGNSARCRHDF